VAPPASSVTQADEWERRGSAAVDAKDLQTARKCFRRAVELDRGNAERRFHLAIVHEALEESAAAAEELTEALRIDALHAGAARRLSSLLSRQILPATARLNPAGLRAVLRHAAVSRDAVGDAVLRHLWEREPLKGVLAQGRTGGWEAAARSLCLKRTGPLLRDEVFLDLLRTGIVKSPELERLLTALRRVLVLEVARQRLADRDLIQFVVALMQQCWVNEHVWMASPEELRAISDREVAIGGLLGGDVDEGHNLLLASLYEPNFKALAAHAGEGGGLARIEPKALGEVIVHRVAEHVDERARVERMPRLGTLVDPTSRKVAEQYEAAPYPRWTRLGLHLREGEMRRGMAQYFDPARLAFMDQPFEVLVAGCGTGMDAIQVALGYRPNARVLGVDLSAASLAYASRMADRLGATNVEFLQADIQELGRSADFRARFRMVECGGVLHHMADPLQGWRALLGCLAPGGLMRIALYSAAARSNLTALRGDPAYPGPGCGEAELRAFRQILLNRPRGQPGSELVGSPDFYSKSGFRDLVLHVSERCFTLPDIQGFLGEAALTFRGFMPPVFFDLLRQHSPEAVWPGTLESWAELERAMPFLFAGMYKFWCEKA
jgi:SAM-dependent methyltransferase